jgi:hypothetical protein
VKDESVCAQNERLPEYATHEERCLKEETNVVQMDEVCFSKLTSHSREATDRLGKPV